MSETRVLVLRTGLFDDGRTAPARAQPLAQPLAQALAQALAQPLAQALALTPDSLSEGFRVTELAVDGDIGAMSTADWDRVLEAVLENDRCITL